MFEEKNPIIGMDVAKIVAIVWICLYHLLDFRNNWSLGQLFGSGQYYNLFIENNNVMTSFSKSLISLGPLGVSLFVIASGLGLSLSMHKNKTNYLQFLKRRVLKIFPLYWFILTLLLLLDLTLNNSINFKDYFFHFLAIHTYFKEFTLSISAPFWFIGVILQLYLIFPLIFKISRKISPLLLLITAIFVKIKIDPALVNFFHGGRYFTEFLVDFCLGISLSHIFIKKPNVIKEKKLFLIIIPLVFIFYLVIFKSVQNTPFGNSAQLIYQLCAALLFITILNVSTFLPNRISPLTKYLSNLSLTIFLTHYLIITKLLTKIETHPSFSVEAVIFLAISFSTAVLINNIHLTPTPSRSYTVPSSPNL